MKRGKILGIGLAAIVLFGLLYTFLFPVVHYGRLTQKWEAQIKRDQDPTQLQAWATRLMNTHTDANPQDVRILHDKPPPGIPRSRYGPNVAVMGGGQYVQLGWGGGMLWLWGMRIGDTNYVCPGGELWKPGVYFFRSP